jgi:iron complex outermembrane recepter protein
MSKRSLYVFFVVIVGLMFVFGGAFPLCAQETKSDEFTLEEITVTAQKRVENQQKVAIPMEVIAGDQLAASGKTNVDEILANISTVMINNAPDGMRVSVRGLQDDNSTFHDMHVSTPAVAINIDGAFNSSSSAGQNLFDLERVEILMGPQSTMYASTSPGGIVNVVTAAPKTDRYSASASMEYASFSTIKAQAMVNAPIVTDKLAMRLAANLQKHDSYYAGDTANIENTKSARLKTLFQPNDKFSTTVSLNYSKKVNGGMMGGQVKAFDTQDGYWYTQNGVDNGPWYKQSKVTNPWTLQPASGGAPGGPPGAPEGSNNGGQTTKGITAEINWDTGIGSLSVVPQYSKTSSDDQGTYESTNDLLTYIVTRKQSETQKGIEARLSSEKDFLFQWILGVNYYKDISLEGSTYTEAAAEPGSRDARQDTHAFFGNITYPFTDKFRGTAGYRRSWDKSSMVELPAMVGNGISGQNYSNPDYKLGVEYDVASNSMVYGTYATSYRVNAMAVAQGGRSVPPEKLKSYTVGAKNRFLQNRLQLNAAAYYYDYTDKDARVVNDGRPGQGVQIPVAEIVDPNGNPIDINGDNFAQTYIQGGPNSTDPWSQQHGAFRTIGADVTADWVLTSKDRVNLSISYLNAKWTDLTLHYYWKRAAAYGGGNFWPNDGKDFSGMTNTVSPTWTITGSYEHNFELGSYGMLVPHIDFTHKTSYVLDLQAINYPLNYQEPYFIVNGNVTFTSASGTWSLNAYVKNATNYAVKNFWQNMSGTYTMGISDPRVYGGVLSVKF